MPSYSALEWGLIFAAAFGDGFLIRTFGAGVGITLTPLLTLAFSARFSLGLLALFSTWAALGVARNFWGKWDRRATFLFLPGIAAGVLAGAWILSWLPEARLRAIIGFLCLLIALYQLFVELRGRPPEIPPLPPWLGVGVGAMSGLSSALANSGAAFLIPILIGQKFRRETIVGTLWILFFCIANPMKVLAFWKAGIIGGHTVWTSLIGLPFLWAGLRVGAWVHHRLPGRAFNLIVLGIALAGSLRLLIAS